MYLNHIGVVYDCESQAPLAILQTYTSVEWGKRNLPVGVRSTTRKQGRRQQPTIKTVGGNIHLLYEQVAVEAGTEARRVSPHTEQPYLRKLPEMCLARAWGSPLKPPRFEKIASIVDFRCRLKMMPDMSVGH